MPSFTDNLLPEYTLPSLLLTPETLALLDGNDESAPKYLCKDKDGIASTSNSLTENNILDHDACTKGTNERHLSGPKSGKRGFSRHGDVYSSADSTLFTASTLSDLPEKRDYGVKKRKFIAESKEDMPLTKVVRIDGTRAL